MKIYYKLHQGKYGLILAACDSDVCGKTLVDSKKKIDFFVNPRFYKEESAGKKEFLQLFAKAIDANLVGKNAVQCGIDLGLINKENVIKIDNVPHAIFSIMVG